MEEEESADRITEKAIETTSHRSTEEEGEIRSTKDRRTKEEY